MLIHVQLKSKFTGYYKKMYLEVKDR